MQAENDALRQQVRSLQEQLATALARIAELENRPPGPPTFVKPNRPKRERQPRRTRDPQHNRARRLEPTPTRIEQHALDRCPDCHQRLRGGVLARRRQVIDLPEPQPVVVTEHQVIKRWCSWCKRWHAPTLDLTGQVLGQGHIGVRIATLIAYLRTTLRLPIRRIQAYLQTIHGLTLSAGEVVELLHQVRRALQPALDHLKAQARASPILHADETGWRQAGHNGYIWSLSTPGPAAVRYYEYDASRAGAVAVRLIGSDYRGHLVSDFYGGYNGLPGPHQRCWVHLLRDLNALLERHGQDVRVRQWVVQVVAVYRLAQQRLGQAPALTPAQRQAFYDRLVARVAELGRQHAQAKGHVCQALAKRLLRHQAELFQFVRVAGLPADNNLAERSVRAVVIMRKISGGTQSAAGSTTRMALASLFETWHARGLNPFDECLTLLRQTPLPQV
ncbi:MAG: IS66 family transposase [Herpetosiphon sp.]